MLVQVRIKSLIKKHCKQTTEIRTEVVYKQL